MILALAVVCGLDPSGGRGYNGYSLASGSCNGPWRILDSGVERSMFKALDRVKGCIVAGVDAPLTLPYKGFRMVERIAMRVYRARLLPGGMKGMRALTLRGFSIRQLLEEAGIAYVETHPGTVAAISGLQGWRGDREAAILAAGVAASHYCGWASYVIMEDGMLAFARVKVRGPQLWVLPV